jgi:enoyl-[acyl-carrier-protein] reductase (NADH)
VRTCLVESSWVLIQKDPVIRLKYNEPKSKKGAKRAIVAITRSLLIRKGALIAFTKDLAVRWAKYAIQVNAIAPGWFVTEMTKWVTEHHRGKMMERLLVKRFGGEDDLKGAVVFLASRASDYVTVRPCVWMGARPPGRKG